MCEITEKFYAESSKLRQSVRDGYILFVDDEEQLCHLFVNLAEKLGYAAKAVCTSAEAIEAIDSDPDGIRCVVVDIHLTADQSDVSGGYAIVDNIEGKHHSLPYLVYTGDVAAAEGLRKKYRRSIVVQKGGSMDPILEALGIERQVARNAG